MKPDETPSAFSTGLSSDPELWFWNNTGAITLRLVEFLDRILRHRPKPARNQPHSLLQLLLSSLVLGVWNWVCVPLWKLKPLPSKNRPYPQKANALFQRITQIILRWNAMFNLNCWPDEE